MLTIIIGIVIVAILGLIAIALSSRNTIPFPLELVLLLILGGAINYGLLGPASEYNDWELAEEIELVSLAENTVLDEKTNIYVYRLAENEYTYRYEIDSQFGTETSKEYEVKTLLIEEDIRHLTTVEEIEDSNCEKPLLKVYKRKGKPTIWTFARGYENTKYVFYVPEGTIAKEVRPN